MQFNSYDFRYKFCEIGPFRVLFTPLNEGPRFLKRRGDCVSTFDLFIIINSEGEVCWHFDLLFLEGQKFTFLRDIFNNYSMSVRCI